MSIIRKATIHDIHALASLFDQYRVFYGKVSDIEAGKAFLMQRISMKESEIFVSEEEDQQLGGFVQLYPLFSSTRMKKLWLLNDLFVHPGFRLRGISIALIEAAKTLCIQTDACGLLLETAMENREANQLYLKTGFTCDDAHNYYSWDVVREKVV